MSVFPSILSYFLNLLYLEGVVGSAVIEIMAQAANNQSQALYFAKDLPPLCGLQGPQILAIKL